MNDGSDPKNPAAANDGVPRPGPNSPTAKAAASWEMPAPIFRVSEGVEVKIIVPEPAAEVDGNGTADNPLAKIYAPPDAGVDKVPSEKEAPAATPSTDIQPQPYLSDEFTLNDIAEVLPAEKKSNPVVRKVLAIFGILCMVLFIIAFIGVVYFLFFYKSDAGSGF
jgi:hypothetical protein